MAATATLLLLAAQLAGATGTLSGIVVDPLGTPVAGARITLSVAGRVAADTPTQPDGSFNISRPSGGPAVLTVAAPGFSTATLKLSDGTSQLRIHLTAAGFTENVTVSARADHVLQTSPGSATVLDAPTLAAAAALTLDDQLRSIPGFSLFRRSSSRVANPTTQGVTLRGLSASGASRTIVLADGVPLNDPFGGWVYWDRLPAASIERVEVARGGSSDLHGTDAIGGAIRIDTSTAGAARIWGDGGSDRTGRLSAYSGRSFGKAQTFGAAEVYTTDGFVIIAPESRGSIDVPARSKHASVYAGAGTPLTDTTNVEIRGSYFSEDRGNGTPFQVNGTIIRQLSAVANGITGPAAWTARTFGASQDYDQTFSVVAPDRESERPSTVQHVDATSAGASFEWLQGSARHAWLVNASFRHVQAGFREGAAFGNAPVSSITARQQTWGLTGQFSFTPASRVTIGAGIRGEIWHEEGELRAEAQTWVGLFPRASVAWRATDAVSLRASIHNAYRDPTINELYRSFRVGNVLTLANAGLRPEESVGLEGAAVVRRGRVTGRATAFWTKLLHPVINETLDTSESVILRQRANVGAVRARGVELEADLRAPRHVVFRAAVAYIASTFVEGGELEGLRVPQVPRWQASAGALATWGRATGSLDYRFIGQQFDDDRNRFVLDPSSVLDLRCAWRVIQTLEVFAAVENVFDADQDVGRTPLRTIGLPRTTRLGLRWASR